MCKPGTQEFDNAVQEAMIPYLGPGFGNPSSLYKLGRQAKIAIDAARESLAALLGVAAEEIHFAPTAPIANGVALLGRARALQASQRTAPFAICHDGDEGLGSIIKQLVESGCSLRTIPLAPGWHQALGEARQAGSCVHVCISRKCSASDLKLAGRHAETFCVHGKALLTPLDVSVLVVKRAVNIMPLVFGGGQERGLFPGTEPVAAIVGLGKAAQLWQV